VNPTRKYHSKLFTLRLWIEPGAPRPDDLRFKVQDLRSGEVRYFGNWPALIAYLDAVFRGSEDDALHCHCPDESL
jgi:hypothetical protein